MATNRWLGSVAAISQVDTFTIGGTPAAGNTVSITIAGFSVTYTVVAGDTVNSVAANFQALLAACTAGMFQDEQWTNASGTAVITATATTAGKPVTSTSSAAGGGVTITGPTNVTPSSGPNDASIGANWSTGAVPTTGDNVLIDVTGSSDILYGLSSIGSYSTLTVPASYQGNIGLPFLNTTTNPYAEYRTRFFPVPSTAVVQIGEGTGQGPTRVYLSSGAVLAATVLSTGNSSVTNVPTVNIIGCTSGVLNFVSGSVGLAADDNTTSATVTTGNMATGTTLTVGSGAVVTTLNQDDGTTYGYGSIPTHNINGGTAYLYAASPTTITANTGNAATVYWLGNGTLGTATFQGQGGNTYPTLNLSTNPSSRTITNGTFTGGGAIIDPNKTSTWSNAFTFDQASLNNSALGERFSVLRS
jgi:hypothetical protein